MRCALRCCPHCDSFLTPLSPTPAVHVAAYDFASGTMYLANAAPDQTPAYARTYYAFDMKAQWARTQ